VKNAIKRKLEALMSQYPTSEHQ